MNSATKVQPPFTPNCVYTALTTGNLSFAISNGTARRFQPDLVPFSAMSEKCDQGLYDLLPLLAPGEETFLQLDAGEKLPLNEGVRLLSTLEGLQMRFTGKIAAAKSDSDLIELTRKDTEDMLDLKARAFPGLFGRRAPELGCFFGLRDAESGRLIAMGGERFATTTDIEISAVCTDPDHTGRGHSARIIQALLGRHSAVGMASILHVARENARAISLYTHLGFQISGTFTLLRLRRLST